MDACGQGQQPVIITDTLVDNSVALSLTGQGVIGSGSGFVPPAITANSPFDAVTDVCLTATVTNSDGPTGVNIQAIVDCQ
jgi:hypothetical protein